MYFVSGSHTIRLWITPMSETSCFITYFTISWIMLCYICLSTIQTTFTYLFLCRWKCMKIMNDDLIVRLSLICTLSFTFWLTFVNKVWLGGGKDKPTVSFFGFYIKEVFIHFYCDKIFFLQFLTQSFKVSL